MKGTNKEDINPKSVLLGNVLNPWMKVVLPLKKNILTSLAKNVLMPLAITEATSVTDADIQMTFTDQERLNW